MSPERFARITGGYGKLRVAVVGDFCLDRYLEIDPGLEEKSLETGLGVHNVVNVRAQPGAAGTVLSNLVALGLGEIWPIGFAGEDGEGFELVRELGRMRGVRMEGFVRTGLRRTFTYCKPLVMEKGGAPRELNRLDSKNWTQTPAEVDREIRRRVREVGEQIDAMIIMDQVDLAETGVVTKGVLGEVGELAQKRGELLVLADSRRGLSGYPAVGMKMNRAELGMLLGRSAPEEIGAVRRAAVELAERTGRWVFVTLAERGLVGAGAGGEVEHLAALPLRGPIDIVGAGDAVSANLAAALAAGGSLREAMELANAGASVVIHQVGTTGTASVAELGKVMDR